ncbi:MAG: Glu-tRNA(Gln) amidotransferase subunit GatE [Candidatus Thermoplasmatota archaeon]|jgi:glutamyl-tRNA(Gln) amidotransferase subunit E|nr:Glu-tRNA(Gln) amidotransferase subunit GatE [Candidatus Thermoplasmatota archaeon]MCL5793662.1 Glu-tRNA(Gln) amidotransferase subunit GatE [Candidatus Thermoplasmatota archaeon]
MTADNGTKIGLEIHVQLNTGKLFCRCSSTGETLTGGKISRKLFATTGEMGKSDSAVKFETFRDRTFGYLITENSCLVEADEEPPHGMDSEALSTALAVAAKLDCILMDRIFVMRKLVIDGSNTSGFQRTALIGIGGTISTSRGTVRISSVCLEEDSARKVEAVGSSVNYSLGRLGVPLIEISTEPDIRDEEHAVETARAISFVVTATGKAHRAAEAIRQDVNVSFGHGRIELKGVSRISDIKDSIRAERERNDSLEQAITVLKERIGEKAPELTLKELSAIFRETQSKILRKGLDSGSQVLGLKLPGMGGILKSGTLRLGRELADAVKAVGVAGLMHSDELPGYGVSEEETRAVVVALSPGLLDGFAIMVARREDIPRIQTSMELRLTKIMSMDLAETRGYSPDNGTYFLRPLAGSERMYPETDVEPIEYDRDSVIENAGKLPGTPEEASAEVARRYGISMQDAQTIFREYGTGLLERISEISSDPRWSARFILQLRGSFESKYKNALSDTDITGILESVRALNLGRESMEKALELVYAGKESPSRVAESGLIKPLSSLELESIVRHLLEKGGPGSERARIIASIRENYGRPFDPSVALKLYESLKASAGK